jgi:pimeloyl-ACP methyl ester carboxylesterase
MDPVDLIYLPGIHGTDDLAEPFASRLPEWMPLQTVAYPGDRFLDYNELERRIWPLLSNRSRPILLLGESFGGPLALRLSARCPVGLVGVVLAATFAASPAPSYLGWVQRYSLRSLFARRPPTLLVRYFVAGLDAPESLLACLRRVRRTTAGWVIAERLREVMREDARPALRAVPTPILYLLADRDRTVRPRSLRTILQERPDTVVHRLPSAHCVLQRQPVQAVEAIRSFLETCPGPLPVGARPRLPYRSPAESKY